MQNNSEIKGQVKYSDNASNKYNLYKYYFEGNFQKKINCTIYPKNVKGEGIQLIIDVISDKVCIFVKTKDNKNYENLETNLNEKDIVNLVNKTPQLIFRNQNIVLKYDEFYYYFYKINHNSSILTLELKNVVEFTQLKLRSPAKGDNDEEVEQISLEEMYEKLGNQWPKDVQYFKEILEHRSEQTQGQIQQIQEKLSEIEQLKKEQQDPDIIKILEIKLQVYMKEYGKHQEIQQIVNQLEQYEWTQLFYLKILEMFQSINGKYSCYVKQRECLDKQLTVYTDDLRRYKLRKQAKDQEDCEKKIQAMQPHFESLSLAEFLTQQFEPLNYKFLSCDETDLYKKDIINIQKQLDQSRQTMELANQKMEEEEQCMKEYQQSIGQIYENRLFHANELQQIQQELDELEVQHKDILQWKDKYNKLSNVVTELQGKHAAKVQQLEQHLEIKGNQIPSLKSQLENKNFELEQLKKNDQNNHLDPKTEGIQDQLNKIKSKNSSLEFKIAKYSQEIQKKKEDINTLKDESSKAQQQLNQMNLNQAQVMQQLASQEVTQKELFKSQQINQKKKLKNSQLQENLQSKQTEIQQISDEIKLIQDRIKIAKQELEKQKQLTNKKDTEIKNFKLRLELNLK